MAAGLGSSSVEAEHLLISIASGNSKAGARAQGRRARAPGAPRRAVQRDFERVLGTVGIDAERRRPRRQLPPHEAELGHVGQAGARARGQGGQAQRRHARSAREHILRGLLAAEHGTVPRILAAEGIDRDELTGRLRRPSRRRRVWAEAQCAARRASVERALDAPAEEDGRRRHGSPPSTAGAELLPPRGGAGRRRGIAGAARSARLRGRVHEEEHAARLDALGYPPTRDRAHVRP